MLYKDIEILQSFLKDNYNITNMDSDEKNKFKYFNEEIVKPKDKIPSIEKLEELKSIEVELHTNFEELYELGNYFDPIFIKIKKNINKLISKYDVRSEIVNNIKPFLNVNGKTNMSDFITGASFIDSKNKYILGVGSVNAHKKNEFITIDSVKKLEEQYKELIKNNISYGKVVTYNDISIEIASRRGIKKMSAQAVGGSVGSNPICIIIPCHRVVGTNNKITGYGGEI